MPTNLVTENMGKFQESVNVPKLAQGKNHPSSPVLVKKLNLYSKIINL